MCIAPNTLADGTQVVCRECWQCRRAKVDDLVGRGIAELRTTQVGAHFVTLTYGRNRDEKSPTYGEAEHERAVVLTYSDPQKLFKLLRVNGYPFRYLISGEYGSTKGRTHFHVIFFWQKRVPPGIVLGENWRWARFDEKTGEQAKGRYGEPAEFWPHGHTFWEPATFEGIRYCVKYVLKEVGQGAEEKQYLKHQSKEPPLGTAYFDDLARRHAEQYLAPADGYYSFPEATRFTTGERIQFRLSGRSEELYKEAFVNHWARLYGGGPLPYFAHCADRHKHKGSYRAEWGQRVAPTNSKSGADYINDYVERWCARPVSIWWPQIEYGAHLHDWWRHRDMYVPEGKFERERYERLRHPLEDMIEERGHPIKSHRGGPDCWGVFEARQRGLNVTSDQFGQNDKGDWYLPLPDGTRLLWSEGKDGGATWRDLKAEGRATRSKQEFEERARNAARTKEPWLLKPLDKRPGRPRKSA